MTPQSLRDALHDTATPPLPVADDLWARGRRRRRRDRVATVAVSVVVLALLVGAGGWLVGLRTPSAEVASTDGLGVPDHLHAVPGFLDRRTGTGDAGWSGGERIESRLDVGRAAVAFLTPGGLPVVVAATDGAYHLLDLPHYQGNNRFATDGLVHPTIALSPSGRYLAYSWATFGPDADTEPIPSGVKVLDLTSGGITGYPLSGEEGTSVEALAWSPDERWLGWAGARLGSWTTMSMGQLTPVAGRIELSSPSAPRSFVVRADQPVVSVDDAGVVRAVSGDASARITDRVEMRGVGLGAGVTEGVVPTDARGRAVVSTTDGLMLLEGSAATRVPAITRDGETLEAPLWPLAWVGQDLLVAAPSQDGSDAGRLLVVSATTGVARPVGVAEYGTYDDLSVATDLVTPDRIVVPRPAPRWPWSDERKIVVGLIALAAAVWALEIGWLRRRRRRIR